MTNILFVFRRFLKSKYLRAVNLLGLSIIFACLILSYSYVKQEISYDRFNVNADRLVRMSVAYSNESDTECRVYDDGLDIIPQQIPEVEQMVKLSRINTVILTYEGRPQVENNVYAASENFFRVFNYPLIQGDKNAVLNASNKVAISESLAKRLFKNESAIGKGVKISSRVKGDTTLFVSGVYKDFPKNSHFHTDLIFQREKDRRDYAYTYLLLKKSTNLRSIETKISSLFDKDRTDKSVSTKITLMPVSDIHLHSKASREMEPNGNINYIYLIIGVNILLIVIVLLNLWLNSSLIFASNKRYYQLLRLNGASSKTVLRDEISLASLLGLLSLTVGGIIAFYLAPRFNIGFVSRVEILLLSSAFLFAIVTVAIIPVLTAISSTLFRNGKIDSGLGSRSFSGIKYLLTAQYVIVMLVVIITFGISKQVALIMHKQIGGGDSCIIVLREQPNPVQERFPLLKSELLKHTEITAVTGAMQLPGSGIRDGMTITVEGNKEQIPVRILVVGNDFLPFFGVNLLAGKQPLPDKFLFQEHLQMVQDNPTKKVGFTNPTEEYIINKKALMALGFKTPEEALGKRIKLDERSQLNYMGGGPICGVVDNFTYTTLFEDNIPLLIFQRALFAQCFFIRLNNNNLPQSLAVFNQVWTKVNPDFPPNYSFLKDEYGKVYQNELNAENLVQLFSLLCLLITNLGLLVFMSFIVKTRTKEIAIRRVNGATAFEIVRMLNWNFIRWIMVAFIISVPVAYYVMQRWLENFVYKTTLNWWIFALAGITVLLLSMLLVSWQSWRAATSNPVEALKGE